MPDPPFVRKSNCGIYASAGTPVEASGGLRSAVLRLPLHRPTTSRQRLADPRDAAGLLSDQAPVSDEDQRGSQNEEDRQEYDRSYHHYLLEFSGWRRALTPVATCCFWGARVLRPSR